MFQLVHARVVLPLMCCAGCAAPSLTAPPELPSPPPDVTGFAWPVGRALLDGLYVMNYVDHDRGSGVLDYGCGTRTFNGHAGLDLSLVDFRAMDAGTAVYAVDAGVVLVAAYHEFDRNLETPYVGTLNNVNMVQVEHDDGTTTWYAHLRKHSVAVQVGERVERGQFLGMIGSSGWSPVPHLHFEHRADRSLTSAVLDPNGAPCHRGTSAWTQPPPYTGRDAIDLLDADVTLDLSHIGSFGNVNGLRAIKERLERPATIAPDTPTLGVWIFHQSPTGGVYRVRLERPDHTTAVTREAPTAAGRPFGWEVLTVPLGPDAPVGQWTLVVEGGGRQVTRAFAVERETRYAPRFAPGTGRSVRLGEGTGSIPATLVRDPGGVTLHLDGEPPGVRLVGRSLEVGSAQLTQRNQQFRLIARDARGYADTAHVHLIDMDKPRSPTFWRP